MVLQSMKIAITIWPLSVGCWANEAGTANFGGCAIGFGPEEVETASGEPVSYTHLTLPTKA